MKTRKPKRNDAHKRIVVYLRGYKPRNAKSWRLHEARKDAMIRYINTMELVHGWSVQNLEIYEALNRIDDYESRDVLRLLTRDFYHGKFNVMIAWSMECLTHTIHDSLNLWESLNDNGVALHLVQQEIDTKSQFGHLLMLTTASRLECNVLGEVSS